MKVWLAMTFVLSAWVQAARCQAFISKEQEIQMSMDIRNLVANSFDEDGLRFLVPGIIRLCFHDCVIICDGCIDTRRKVQGGNNGLANTWLPLKKLYNKYENICSRADFFALACTVTSDYAAERGEQEGLCVPTPGVVPNDCRTNMEILWGRRTCAVPQLVTPVRNIPNANEDPYKWFGENMDMTPREAVCLMGSHTLGKLRSNETGFSGDYTPQMDVLSNEFFTMMASGTSWKQHKKNVVIDEFPQTRFQWENPDKTFTRVNSDMMLMYDLGKLRQHGEAECLIEPLPKKKKEKHCKKQPHWAIVEEMAADNKAFIACFGAAMNKMMRNGYKEGELVPTGQIIPPPLPDTTPAPGTAQPGPSPPVPPPRRPARRPARRNRNKKSRRKQKSKGRKRNRLQLVGNPAPTPRPQAGPLSLLTNLLSI